MAQALFAAIDEQHGDTLGDIDHRDTAYVVRHPVQKCIPEQIEAFDEAVRGQIGGFFASYAHILSGLGSTIDEHIARITGASPASAT